MVACLNGTITIRRLTPFRFYDVPLSTVKAERSGHDGGVPGILCWGALRREQAILVPSTAAAFGA
jgi:hypothetical protein